MFGLWRRFPIIAESERYDKSYRTHVECYVMLLYTDPLLALIYPHLGCLISDLYCTWLLKCTRSSLFLSIKIVKHDMQELIFSAVQPPYRAHSSKEKVGGGGGGGGEIVLLTLFFFMKYLSVEINLINCEVQIRISFQDLSIQALII